MYKSLTQKITYTGIMTALVFLGTFVIKVPTPFTNGYIHLGDAFVFLSGLILGPVYGAFAAGVGSCMSDLLGGYAQWVLPTLIIKSIMAAIIGILAIKKESRKAIFIICTAFSIIWIGFNLLMRSLLFSSISSNPSSLLPEVEGINSVTDLIQLANNVQNRLLIIALLIPVFMILILLIFKKLASVKFNYVYSVGFVISGSFMVIGYYVASYFIYGSLIVPILEIPANIIQFIFGLLIAHLLLPVIEKLKAAN